MAATSSMSECVSICMFWKGETSGRYDCGVLACAWKAPRVLTGSLASTAHPPSCSSLSCSKIGRRNCFKFQGEFPYGGGWHSMGSSNFMHSGRLFRSSFHHIACQNWQVHSSSSFSSEQGKAISPERLWELAFEAHDGQKRCSGEPFIVHPVEVARILGELELDWESVGLLHDTVEDTNFVTFERIEEEFGATVRYIVEGETKVSKLGKLNCKNENSSAQDVEADDLRQMFLAVTEEIHVTIVKLADRLHNMRTLSHMPPHKQTSIATETLQVFAPLAKPLGMYQIKDDSTISNGYQSLRTTVIPFLHESMFQLEVQIRTEEMDLISERGIAAHYSGRLFITGLVGHAMPNGRNSGGKPVHLNNANIALRIGWLNAIREWQEEFGNL